LQEEVTLIQTSYKRALQGKEQELEMLTEQLLRKSGLESKIRELESKVASSRELAKELEEQKLVVRDIESKLRDAT
jgi:hypothetical protein